jgi:hypothetical protein
VKCPCFDSLYPLRLFIGYHLKIYLTYSSLPEPRKHNYPDLLKGNSCHRAKPSGQTWEKLISFPPPWLEYKFPPMLKTPRGVTSSFRVGSLTGKFEALGQGLLFSSNIPSAQQ